MPLAPWLLIALRLLLGPAIIALALAGAPGYLLVLLLWLGVVSDIFDGIIARRLGVATNSLRRCDSQTDLIFFLCVIAACFVRAPAALTPWLPAVLTLLALEGLIYAVSFARFRREPCTHAYTAKVFGLAMLLALSVLLARGYTGIPFMTMLALAAIMQLDCLAIVLTLPRWERDVPSTYHAWRLRQGHTIRRHGLFHSA